MASDSMAGAKEIRELRTRLAKLERDWGMLRAHVTTIADAGARNEERQKVFVELREIMKRLEDA